MLYSTREEWLEAGVADLASTILPGGVVLPKIKVSVGFPKGHRGRGKAVGQCFMKEASADAETFHIFISPTQEVVADVLGTLLHEVIHALTPGEGHRGGFSKLAAKVGFLKPWTSSVNKSEGLVEMLKAVEGRLLAYPHVGLNYAQVPKQTTRLRLYECIEGKKIRHAGDDLAAICLDCETRFELKESK